MNNATVAFDQPSMTDLLALNNAHAQELSFLDPDRFTTLAGMAFLARRICPGRLRDDPRGGKIVRYFCRELTAA